MDVAELLQGTEFEPLAGALADEFERAGITADTLHNAPLKVNKTHGADIYKLIEVLEAQIEAQAKAGKRTGKDTVRLEGLAKPRPASKQKSGGD